MYKITKIAFLLMLATVVALGFVSCRQSDLDERATITADQPTTLTLNIDEEKFTSVATRTETTENSINSLALFVFNSKGKLITRSFFEATTLGQIKVNTFSGNDMRVVAIANFDQIKDLDEQLATAANYDVLNDIVVTHSTTSPGSSVGILMTGETVVDIIDSPGGTAINLKMQFAVAKVTLSIKVAGDKMANDESLEIFNIALGSIASNGYLISRTSEPETRTYDKLVDVAFNGNQTDGLTATFYILENIRGGRTNSAPPSEIIEDATNGHLFKRHYAPDNSSHAIISAYYRKAGQRSKRVDMYIYFGHNNSDNYNVGRGENHTYSIIINGLDNINIDTNVEATDFNFDLSYGDNLAMDAHADTRSLILGKSNGMINIEVLDANGRRVGDAGFAADWVKLSPLDLMKHQVRAQKGNGSKGEWQQTGSRYEIVRGKYIPHKSVRNLIGTGGWNAIPAGKDDDDRMTYADATYRMCYAITDISLTDKREIIIYADENMTGAQRMAKIEVRFRDASGAEQVEVLTITQVPLYSVGSAGGHEMLIESFEEYSFNVYLSSASQLKKHDGASWGFYNSLISPPSNVNGDFLTANAVYGYRENEWMKNNSSYVQSAANGLPTWDTDISYRTKYGYREKTYDWDTYYGEISAPYYYPNYDSEFQAYSPIYNSSAARYCHEKNRDQNGDGVISPDEAHWFLPSSSELMVIAKNQSKLPQSIQMNAAGGNYWSSTEGGINTAYTYDFNRNYIQEQSKNRINRIRCVRRGEKAKAENVYVDPNNSVIIDNTLDFPSDMITSTPKPSIPAGENSDLTIGSRFIVARNNQNSNWTYAAGMTDFFIPMQLGDNLWSNKESGCVIYSELPDHSDKGQWRLPTKGELARIADLLPNLESITDFTPFKDAWYWSATENPGNGVYNSWAINPRSKAMQTFGRGALHDVRCIRQI